jgi:nicotinamidase-related amidase
MQQTALLIVDIQNDYFPGGAFELEGAEAAAKNAAKALAAFRAKKLPILHIRHENPSSEAGFFLPGTHGAEIHPEAAPLAGEKVLIKHFPNSFLETGLEQELRRLEVGKVVVIGMMTLLCIDATVRAARDLGFEVVVLHDACAARDLEFNGVAAPAAQVHAAFLAALQLFYAEVVNTDSIVNAL